MAVGVELAQDVAENLRQGQTAVADMAYFALQGMEVLIVDPYFDFVVFFMVIVFRIYGANLRNFGNVKFIFDGDNGQNMD